MTIARAHKQAFPGNSERICLRDVHLLVLFLFFVSGACALIYEIVWLRYFISVFGITIYATSAVLAAFMGGLALGSCFFGRLADRYQWSLHVYGTLEIAIGLYALMMPSMINWMTSLHRIIHQELSDDFTIGLVVRFSMALLLMLVPASLMGATLPIMTNFWVSHKEGIGRQAGRLYAINTFGAVLGTIGTGFFLIPRFGLSISNYLAAAVSLSVGLLALFLSRWVEARNGAELSANAIQAQGQRTIEQHVTEASVARDKSTWILVVIFSSGFAALSYEIVWTRVISIITFNTVFAFTTMLAAFLTGLAVGSYVLARMIDRIERAAFWYGALQVAIGLYALISPLLFGKLADYFYNYQIAAVSNQPSSLGFGARQYVLALLIMLGPTILMGGSFPIAFKLYAMATGRRSGVVGDVYASNTLGAILGSIAAGLLMVPMLGLRGSLLVAASLNLIGGVIGLYFASSGAATFIHRQVVVLPVIAVAFFVFTKVDVVFSDRVSGQRREIVFQEEDITGIVEIWQTGDLRFLVTNRLHTEGSNIPEEVYKMKKQGYLPLLLHSKPESFIEIGLGTGIGLAPVLYDTVKGVEIVELSPGVVNAASLFAKENLNVLSHSKVRVIIDDGRNHLDLASKRYDVIVLGLFTPYRAGVGYLYTREFYEGAREKLRKNGMLFQWLPSGQLTPENLKLVMNTLRNVFPYVYVWEKGFYMALLGMNEKLAVDMPRFKAAFRNPSIRADLKEWHLDDPYNFLASYVMGPEEVEQFTKGAPLNTEDNLRLEFSNFAVLEAAYSRKYAIENLQALLRYRMPAFEVLQKLEEKERLVLARYTRAREQALRGLIHEAKGQYKLAHEWFRRAKETNPKDDIAAASLWRFEGIKN